MADKIEMRDGSTVDDARFGLLAAADPRDHEIETDDVGEVIWEVDQAFNQGLDGPCVGFAFTHALRAQGWQFDGIDDGFANSIYLEAQRIDPWPGGQYPGARPVMAGTSLRAGAKVLHRAGWIPDYRFARSTSQVIAGLQEGPGVLGLRWRRSMNDVGDDSILEVSGRAAGGHAICVAGYVDEKFLLVNSWGDSWGDDGHAWITEADMAKVIKRSERVGEVVFPGRHPRVALDAA